MLLHVVLYIYLYITRNNYYLPNTRSSVLIVSDAGGGTANRVASRSIPISISVLVLSTTIYATKTRNFLETFRILLEFSYLFSFQQCLLKDGLILNLLPAWFQKTRCSKANLPLAVYSVCLERNVFTVSFLGIPLLCLLSMLNYWY